MSQTKEQEVNEFISGLTRNHEINTFETVLAFHVVKNCLLFGNKEDAEYGTQKWLTERYESALKVAEKILDHVMEKQNEPK